MRATLNLLLPYPEGDPNETDDIADGAGQMRLLAQGIDTLLGAPGTTWVPNVWQGTSPANVVWWNSATSTARYQITGNELTAYCNLAVTSTSAANGIIGITVPIGFTKPSSPASGYGVGLISRSSGAANTLCNININDIVPATGGQARIFEFDDRPATGSALVSGDRILMYVQTEIR